jgi:Tfp pilus assembly protein PilZ
MDIVESRQEERYTVSGRVEGTLAGIEVVLVDLGLHGVQLKHATPIKLGSSGKLALSIAGSDEKLEIPAHVVWSRLATKAAPGGERPYFTGARLDDKDGKMASVIGRLLNMALAKPDKESIERKKKTLEERQRSKQQPGIKFFGARAPRVPDDVILLVRQTRQRLQANPAENVKWLNRAKYSLDEAGVQIHHRDDVLAVWEYLERSVELDIIARVLDSK